MSLNDQWETNRVGGVCFFLVSRPFFDSFLLFLPCNLCRSKVSICSRTPPDHYPPPLHWNEAQCCSVTPNDPRETSRVGGACLFLVLQSIGLWTGSEVHMPFCFWMDSVPVCHFPSARCDRSSPPCPRWSSCCDFLSTDVQSTMIPFGDRGRDRADGVDIADALVEEMHRSSFCLPGKFFIIIILLNECVSLGLLQFFRSCIGVLTAFLAATHSMFASSIKSEKK